MVFRLTNTAIPAMSKRKRLQRSEVLEGAACTKEAKRERRLALRRKAKAVRRAAETQEQRAIRLAKEATNRANEMPFQRERRLAKKRRAAAARRHPETAKENERLLSEQRLAKQSTAAMRAVDIPVAKKKTRLPIQKKPAMRIIINNKIFLLSEIYSDTTQKKIPK